MAISNVRTSFMCIGIDGAQKTREREREQILQSSCIMHRHLSSCLDDACQQDGASSFYSRYTESAAPFGTASDIDGQYQPTKRMPPDTPEVNQVDNTI